MASSELFSEFNPSNLEGWKLQAQKELKGKPIESLDWNYFNSLHFKPYYTHVSPSGHHGEPGSFPFVRSGKIIDNGWIVREEIFKSKDLKRTNNKALKAIENGAQNLVFVVNADSSGFEGIPIKNVDDLSILLADIDVEKIGISFRSSQLSPFYHHLLYQYAEIHSFEKGIFGSIDNDPIGQMLADGQSSRPIAVLLDHSADAIKQTANRLPYYKTLEVRSNTFHNAGATILEELAYTLSLGHEYLVQMLERGLTPEQIANTLQFRFSIGSSFFLEIAKLRAARLLWANITDAYFDDKSLCLPYIVAQTSEWNKTLYDPYVNMLRTTTEGLSAGIAGADEIQIDAFDRGYTTPKSFSSRIARNTHHLLAGESKIDRVIDPSAGSYYIENLTESLAQSAWEMFKSMESEGGFLAAIKKGSIQNQLLKTRKTREENLSRRKEIFVGINDYPNAEDKALDRIDIDDSRTEYEAADNENTDLFGSIENYAKYHFAQNGDKVKPLESYVASEALEQLRGGNELAAKEFGMSYSIFIMPIGQPAMSNARANFIFNFFGCGGFKIVNNPVFESVKTALEAFDQSPCKMVVVCSSDEEYEALIPLIAKGLKKHRPTLALAGNPGEKADMFESMGVESFIHIKSDLVATLSEFAINPENQMHD